MGRFAPREGLDVAIAERFGQPAIRRALHMLEDSAKGKAPPVRVWVTVRDERVRATHFETDTQVVPDNLRFKIPKYANATEYDLARHPRDPTLPEKQRINCRCDDPVIEGLLRDSIHATDVHVTGTRVSGSVETRFPRATESETGTSEDKAAHFMLGALREVSARLRAGHTG